MARTPRWQRLSEALASVSEATGLSRTEAQADICGAIADGAIKIQCALGRRDISHMTSRGTILDGDKFQIPRNLQPTDFDWATSRPLEPWFLRRETSKIPGYWYLDWIELRQDDVMALCESVAEDKPAQRSKDAKKRRSQPAFDRAQNAITALYPSGVPPQTDLPNWILYKRVDEWLKKNRLPNVSHDSILRAAGRRK